MIRLVVGLVLVPTACMDANPGVDYTAKSFIGDIGQGSGDRSGPTITAVHFGSVGSATFAAHFASFDDMTSATIPVTLETDAGSVTLNVHPSACGGGCPYFDCSRVSAEVDDWTAGDLDGSATMDSGQGSCVTTDGHEQDWID